MIYSVVQYDPPIKGTVICHFCGCTNHGREHVTYFKVDGIMACGGCWNVVKRVTNFIGLTEYKTPMCEIVQIMKKARKANGRELPRCEKRKRVNEICGATNGLIEYSCPGLVLAGECPRGHDFRKVVVECTD
jgi:hypothetical protein